MRPMLATKGDRVPTGAEWTHEVKWDGMRVLVDRRPDGTDPKPLRIWSRNENDVTVSFPELHPLATEVDDALLDGEVVALGQGVPSFGALADRMHVRDVNRAVRDKLGTRKASFAPPEVTRDITGHEIGGVTVFGLPDGMPIWVDARVMQRERIVLGGGSRSWKVIGPPALLERLPGLEVVEDLAKIPEPAA